MQQVADLTELRALVGHGENELVFVRDLGSTYRYDPASLEEDDSDQFVKPTNVGPAVHPGRWVLAS
jgi:hypothetical protein